MRESIKMQKENCNFKFRVSGLIIRNNKILLVDMDNSGFLSLPGGHVELGETTKEAIIREIKEETKKEITIKKYLGVIENYFINKHGIKTHEIAFYYQLNFVDNKINEEDFMLIENDKGNKIKLDFKWIDIENIEKYNVRPTFIKELLKNNNLEFNHIILNK